MIFLKSNTRDWQGAYSNLCLCRWHISDSKNKVFNNLSFPVIGYIFSGSSELIIIGSVGENVGWSYMKEVMANIPVKLRDCTCSLI